MKVEALDRLSLMARLPSSGDVSCGVEIESACGWHESACGWHYLIALDAAGVRRRVVGRVSWSAHVSQHYPSEFTLPSSRSGFAPTLRELGVIEEDQAT
jgi:hypothetical protein